MLEDNSMDSWESGDGRDDRDKSRQRTNMACVHCRRRKIRCDGGRPACANCQRLGKICDYEPITEEENLIAREKKRASRLKKAQQGSKSSSTINSVSTSSSRLATGGSNAGPAMPSPYLLWDGGRQGSSNSLPPSARPIPGANYPHGSQLTHSGGLRHSQSLGYPSGGRQDARHKDLGGPSSYNRNYASPSSQQWQPSATGSSSYPYQNYGHSHGGSGSLGGTQIAAESTNLGDDLPDWARTTFANQNPPTWAPPRGDFIPASSLGAYEGSSSNVSDISGRGTSSSASGIDSGDGSVSLLSPSFVPASASSANILNAFPASSMTGSPMVAQQNAYSGGYWPSTSHSAEPGATDSSRTGESQAWQSQSSSGTGTNSWLETLDQQQQYPPDAPPRQPR